MSSKMAAYFRVGYCGPRPTGAVQILVNIIRRPGHHVVVFVSRLPPLKHLASAWVMVAQSSRRGRFLFFNFPPSHPPPSIFARIELHKENARNGVWHDGARVSGFRSIWIPFGAEAPTKPQKGGSRVFFLLHQALLWEGV